MGTNFLAGKGLRSCCVWNWMHTSKKGWLPKVAPLRCPTCGLQLQQTDEGPYAGNRYWSLYEADGKPIMKCELCLEDHPLREVTVKEKDDFWICTTCERELNQAGYETEPTGASYGRSS